MVYFIMVKEIILNGRKVQYELYYKKVKNINLRVKPDGTVYVSASKLISQKYIEEFLIFNADFILKALSRFEQLHKEEREVFFSEEEVTSVILDICHNVYLYFETKGINFPQIKFRKMVSRWGSCNPSKGILTFNINLMYAPIECIEYVVMHEFTHFLQANHSQKFYYELEKICPDWRRLRKKLKEITIF